MDFTQDLLLVDKPHGITSFDVIRRLRRVYAEQHGGAKAPKLGHAGTLDPAATGLMLIGVGSGTKRLADLTKLDKVYEAEIRLGEQRSTGDLEGAVVAEKAVTEPLAELVPKVSTALTEMQGEIELPVSAYSAIKVDGTPMYKRARRAERRGETVPDVPLRTMQVLSAELQKLEQQEAFVVAAVRFHVGSGTYIRSLAEELGRRVGYPATVQALRRTHVGEYRIEDAAPVPATK